ncbi:hypothetical protein VTN00DRAFT_7632 [Thermoascus crustaceus]|uniref:uncharacterized protein n=1 Tax=Thermoascus crustaceus TaxID=5088 RepID=UPI0037422A19
MRSDLASLGMIALLPVVGAAVTYGGILPVFSTEFSTEWTSEWSTEWRTEWSTDWSTDWSTEWSTEWSTDWSTQRSTECSTEWSTETETTVYRTVTYTETFTETPVYGNTTTVTVYASACPTTAAVSRTTETTTVTGIGTITSPGTTVTTVSTIPPSTVTLPPSTITIPAFTTTTTTTLPPETMTLTGSMTSRPAITVTSTITLPASTKTLPGTTSTVPAKTVTKTVILPGSTSTVTTTAIVTAPGVTVTEPGPTSTLSTTVTSGLSICSSRIVNPTYTPVAPLPSDYVWGCPPGYLCHPRKSAADGDCNFEAGPPADTYYCSPEECIPSPKLPPPQYWGEPVVSHEIGKYNVTPGYFNLDPTKFGLDYSIFAFPYGKELGKRSPDYIRWGRFLHRRQASGAPKMPGTCYDECNDAMVEAESMGLSSALCRLSSAFKKNLSRCEGCIKGQSNDTFTCGDREIIIQRDAEGNTEHNYQQTDHNFQQLNDNPNKNNNKFYQAKHDDRDAIFVDLISHAIKQRYQCRR